ncbi:MAG: hypothetical protein BroJett029_38210 [Alphaproteobacteria bacterium]|nr:MAG: hypothetical protein BroJett029_38210 [Alphaproteobacteria bacterium]
MIGAAASGEGIGVRSGWLAPALLALGLVTAARLAFIAWADLDLDFEEAQYWFWSRDLAWGYFSKPPLIAWLIAGGTALCGDGEACIRWPSPVIHAATAFVVGAIGAAVAAPRDRRRVALWSALGYATLPGVSLSALLMTTDVPLLFFWSVALLAWIRLMQGGGAGWAVLGGLALGLGLLSKYAMAYVLVGAAVHLAVSAEARCIARRRIPALLAFLATGLALLAPNIAWNAADGFITFRHTAENANLDGGLLHPIRMLEFLGGQFGVFGPVLFVVLLAALPAWWRQARRPASDGPSREASLALGAFCYPVIGLLLVQALISRANANWAATAYVAGTVIAVRLLVAGGRLRLLAASFGLHLAAAAALHLALAWVPAVALPGLGAKPVAARLQGWDALGLRVTAALAARPGSVLASEYRQLLWVLAYYAGLPPGGYAKWNGDGDIEDHFELIGATVETAAAAGATRFVLASERPEPMGILDRFDEWRLLEAVEQPLGAGLVRRLWLYELSGFRGY